MKFKPLLISWMLLSTPAWANQTLTVNFSDINNLDATNSTGLWNVSLGQIQAVVSPTFAATRIVNFGDGSDGSFSDGPSIANGNITVALPTITFNTTGQSVYQFTNFTLTSGKTIHVTGTNPLVIRVLGSTSIAGNIIIDGSAGTNQQAAATAAGGTGVGSGSNGGIGGFGAGTVTSGTTVSATKIAGGGAGTDSGTSTGEIAGTGGCYGSGPDAGDAGKGLGAGAAIGPAPTCTVDRTTLAQGFDNTLFAGGAGGGGGGALQSTYGGGGGGAGGAALRISSVGTIQISGIVNAKGGAGGSTTLGDGADCGGGGGGGSGGAIFLQTANTLIGGGTLNVSGGTGGTDGGVCSGLYVGGVGSRGAVRSDTSDGSIGTLSVLPAGSGNQNATMAVPNNATSYTVTSNAFDLGQENNLLNTVTETYGCGAGGSIAVTYEGSTDQSTYSAGVTAANISQLNAYRYIRFVTQITTGATTPCLKGISLDYCPAGNCIVNTFQVEGGMFCGSMVMKKNGQRESRPPVKSISGDVLMLGLAYLIARRLRLNRNDHVSSSSST